MLDPVEGRLARDIEQKNYWELLAKRFEEPAFLDPRIIQKYEKLLIRPFLMGELERFG
jgi:hypothetical protein